MAGIDKKPRIGVDLSLLRPPGFTCVDFEGATTQKLGRKYSQAGLTFTSWEGLDLEIRQVANVKDGATAKYLTVLGFLDIWFPAPATWVEVSVAKIAWPGVSWHPSTPLKVYSFNANDKQSNPQIGQSQDPDGLVRSYALSASEPAWASGPVTAKLGPITRASISGAPGILLYRVCYW